MPVKSEKKKYLFGTDPELFVWDIHTNKGVSAHDLIPGSKQHPHKTKHGYVQPDGVAAEFNIQPVETPEEFAESVENVIDDLREIITGKMSDALLLSSPTMTFSEDYLRSLPPEVQALGCMPDYNAWTLTKNESPDGNVNFRTGGFHLHVGHTKKSVHDPDHFRDCADRVRQLEAAVYPASILWDIDSQRRKLYGQMGAFRPKKYGFEWRSLSNAILKYKKDGLIWLVDTAKKAMEDYDDGFFYIEDDYVRQTLAKIAVSNVRKDELEYYSKTYMPMTNAIEPPSFID